MGPKKKGKKGPKKKGADKGKGDGPGGDESCEGEDCTQAKGPSKGGLWDILPRACACCLVPGRQMPTPITNARHILVRANGPNSGTVNVIGLNQTEQNLLREMTPLCQTYLTSADGLTVTGIPTHCVMNMLGFLGFKVVAMTGVSTIVWTMVKNG